MAKSAGIGKESKLGAKEYMAKRKEMLTVLGDFKEKLNKKFTILADKYISDNCTWKVGDVLCTDKVKRRGYTRFVIFIVDIIHFTDNPLIRIGGWWINETTNVCEKWDAYVVSGISNPTEFIKSANQKYKKPGSKTTAKAKAN